MIFAYLLTKYKVPVGRYKIVLIFIIILILRNTFKIKRPCTPIVRLPVISQHNVACYHGQQHKKNCQLLNHRIRDNSFQGVLYRQL